MLDLAYIGVALLIVAFVAFPTFTSVATLIAVAARLIYKVATADRPAPPPYFPEVTHVCTVVEHDGYTGRRPVPPRKARRTQPHIDLSKRS